MSDLQSCSNKCEDHDKFEFLVKGNTVILKVWYSWLNSKTPDYTQVLENCSVIDKNICQDNKECQKRLIEAMADCD